MGELFLPEMQDIHLKALMCNAKTFRDLNAKVKQNMKEVIQFPLNYSCKIAVSKHEN